MKMKDQDFRNQLRRFIPFRGIDIVLHLEDGSTLELDKNRQLEGDFIIKKNRSKTEMSIPLQDIIKADFYAA